MEMSKRAMSLEETKEMNKTDLEYKKLEAQITNDKDKLKWEKEKLTTAVKADSDLQVLKNSGLLDLERLKQIGEKDKQKIMEEGANARNKYSTDATAKTAYLTTLGTILGHAQEVSQTGIDGQTKTSKPTAEVGNAARALMTQAGIASPEAAPGTQRRNVLGEAEFAAGVLREHEKAGTKDAARSYLNALPADTRQAALALLNPGGDATPAPGVQPAVSPTAAVRPTAIAPVQPAAPQPTAPAATPPSGGGLLDNISKGVGEIQAKGRPIIAPAAPAPGTGYGTISQNRLELSNPFAGVMDNYGSKFNTRRNLTATETQKKEEEKNRALRRARGLTVGGSF